MKYKRIVFKVGTSSLTNEDGSLSRSKVKDITQQLAMLHEAGHELILVSSGAIAAGFGALGFKKRPTKIADKPGFSSGRAGTFVGRIYDQSSLASNRFCTNLADPR
ncbi:glutamate 5-kinase [Streptococcus pneumoniae]|nr:glutamate 5-kinase [Streptococcus pneumoniae]